MMQLQKKKRLWALVHGVIADYRYGEKGKHNGKYWIQYQPFSIRGAKGVVIVDAYGVVNRTFERLSRSEIEAALMKGRALFIVVDDPDYHVTPEPLVTNWVTSDADVHKVEAALQQYFDLYAVIAIDDHLGNQVQLNRYKTPRHKQDADGHYLYDADDSPITEMVFEEDTRVHYSEAQLPDERFQAILPGCRVAEWGEDVCSIREDLRPYAYRLGDLATAKRLAARGLNHHDILRFDQEQLSGPHLLQSHEWPAVVRTLHKMTSDFVGMTQYLRWGAYPDHIAREFHSTLAGYGLEDYTARILDAVRRTCTHPGVQDVKLRDGTKERVAVIV